MQQNEWNGTNRTKALAVCMCFSTHALFCKMEDSSCECIVIKLDSDEENTKQRDTLPR